MQKKMLILFLHFINICIFVQNLKVFIMVERKIFVARYKQPIGKNLVNRVLFADVKMTEKMVKGFCPSAQSVSIEQVTE